MEKGKNPPVYRSSYRLLIEVLGIVDNMKKSHKYTVGERLRDEAIDLSVNILTANQIKVLRADKILKSQENIEAIKLILRVLLETKQVSHGRFSAVSLELDDVSKQLSGWYKSS